MTRFLRYSQEKQRKIRMVLMLEGRLAQKTVLVLCYDSKNVTLQIGQKKTPVVVPFEDVLGCDYARGDHGEE